MGQCSFSFFRLYSRCQHGKIVTPETNSSGQTEVYVYYDNVPSLLNVPTSFTSGKLTWTYLTAIHSSSDVAKNAYLEGMLLHNNKIINTANTSTCQ